MTSTDLLEARRKALEAGLVAFGEKIPRPWRCGHPRTRWQPAPRQFKTGWRKRTRLADPIPRTMTNLAELLGRLSSSHLAALIRHPDPG